MPHLRNRKVLLNVWYQRGLDRHQCPSWKVRHYLANSRKPDPHRQHGSNSLNPTAHGDISFKLSLLCLITNSGSRLYFHLRATTTVGLVFSEFDERHLKLRLSARLVDRRRKVACNSRDGTLKRRVVDILVCEVREHYVGPAIVSCGQSNPASARRHMLFDVEHRIDPQADVIASTKARGYAPAVFRAVTRACVGPRYGRRCSVGWFRSSDARRATGRRGGYIRPDARCARRR